MGKLKNPPIISNPQAAAQLERAASAAGLSVQQLADLVFEAGVVPPKGKDGVTERYTLLDLGNRLWATMQSTPKDERMAWFDALVPVQKTAVIVALREHGFRTEVIAKDLGIPTETVMRTWNAYSSDLGAQVVGIRLDTIAGQLQIAAERSQQMAVEAGDHSAYWRIHKELVAMLQSIGIVDQAIRRVEVTHKLDDEQKRELEQLVDLRKKQEKRKIEIEELTRTETQGDELPDDLDEDDDDEE